MSSQRRFWIVVAVALLSGVPLALTVRHQHTSPREHEHSDGADMATHDALEKSTGVARVTLLKQALHDPMPAKRLAAAEALEEERGEQRVALLTLALQDNDSVIRTQAVHSLFRNPDKAAQERMRDARRDDDTWVRQAVLQGLSVQTRPQLAALGPWVVPDLMERLDDSDATTRSFGHRRKPSRLPFPRSRRSHQSAPILPPVWYSERSTVQSFTRQRAASSPSLTSGGRGALRAAGSFPLSSSSTSAITRVG